MLRQLGWMAAIAIVAGTSAAWGGNEASAERGRALFEDPKLGKTGKSCASCHPGGRKIEWAAKTFEEEKLVETVNGCIRGMLKGTPLPEDSEEMRSLILYIRTLGGP